MAFDLEARSKGGGGGQEGVRGRLASGWKHGIRTLRAALTAHADEQIRIEICCGLEQVPGWYGQWSKVFVKRGEVRLGGVFLRESDKARVRAFVESVPGVRSVEDARLQYGDWQPVADDQLMRNLAQSQRRPVWL